MNFINKKPRIPERVIASFSIFVLVFSLFQGALGANTVHAIALSEIFSDGFEAPANLNKWTNSGWNSSNDQHTGTKSAKLVGNNTSQTLSKTISTIGYDPVGVSFWFLADSLEWSLFHGGYDYVDVEYTTNGSSWNNITRIDGNDADDVDETKNWKQVSFTIPSEGANNPKFGLRFKGSLSSGEDRVYIDDVLIQGEAMIEDEDGDGIADDSDNCPTVANPGQADTDGDRIGDACDKTPNGDDDGDGIDNDNDNCPKDSNSDQADDDADGIGDVCDSTPHGDIDKDDVDDDSDNCPSTPNADQSDIDVDGIGDACDDTPNGDSDNDGIDDVSDNCPVTQNPDQLDIDSDGIGDVCDSTPNGDSDQDGVDNNSDNCQTIPNQGQADTDLDGIGDACDDTPNGDTDDDGFDTDIDNCPEMANPGQEDTDEDGVGDVCDSTPNGDVIDEDNDGDGDTEDLEYCTVEIVSDTTNTVVEKDGVFAQALSFMHSAWTASIPGATWIWGDNPVVNPVADETQTFEKSFAWNGPVTSATLEIASDNSHIYTLNGISGGDATEKNFTASGQDSYDVTSAIVSGNNDLTVAVKNWAGSSDPKANPAGLLYKLTVTGTDKNCGEIPEEPTLEEIKMCKFDALENPVGGWTMTLSNGVTSTTHITSEETGCVTATVNANEGPWDVTEENREDWTLLTVSKSGGEYLYENDSNIATGCTFFGKEEDIENAVGLIPLTMRMAVKPENICTFMNKYDERAACLTPNLLTNGGFEEPVISIGWSRISNPLGWMVKEVAQPTIDTVLEFHRSWSGNVAAEGDQYVELGADLPVEISQTVVTEEGAKYKLFWSFAPRQDTADTENILSVIINGSEVATEGPTAGIGTLIQKSWVQGSHEFIAGASTDVMFRDSSTGPRGSYGTFLDDAYLCMTEKPETDDQDDEDGDDNTGGGSHGGGTIIRTQSDNYDDGEVQGASNERERTDEEEKPEGEVQGAQTTRVPEVAGASTGAGGTSPKPLTPVALLLTTVLLGAIFVQKTMIPNGR